MLDFLFFGFLSSVSYHSIFLATINASMPSLGLVFCCGQALFINLCIPSPTSLIAIVIQLCLVIFLFCNLVALFLVATSFILSWIFLSLLSSLLLYFASLSSSTFAFFFETLFNF